ncbi:MAG: cytochrome c biogenesis protein [Nitrospinae bacterium]|nr:cytochrome c biogenesis protein [Nitrospinota bacterium]
MGGFEVIKEINYHKGGILVMHLLLLFSLIAYFFGIVAFFHHLFRRRPLSFKGAIFFISLGFLSHSAILVGLLRYERETYSIPFGYFTFFSWCIVLASLLAEFRFKIRYISFFLIPISMLLLGHSYYQPHLAAEVLYPTMFWFFAHTIFFFLGYAALAITFAVGIMFILQERQLKSKQAGLIYHRLPSLEVLDHINGLAVDIGFPLISAGIMTGIIWSRQRYLGGFIGIDKLWPVIATWIIYAILFFGRIVLGWRGRRAAQVSVIGFMVALLGYVLHII